MQITEVIVSAGRTFNDPYESYANFKPSLALKASLAEGEDADLAVKELQAKAEKLMDAHKAKLLKNAEEDYNDSIVSVVGNSEFIPRDDDDPTVDYRP